MSESPIYDGLGSGENEKRCPKCQTVKSTDEFPRNRSTKDGLHSWCKRCVNLYERERRAADPEGFRARSRAARKRRMQDDPARVQAMQRKAELKHFYNMTPEQYAVMLVAQGGHCAICPRKPGKYRLHVDHDHSCCPGKRSCGKCVRGLLCKDCNQILLGRICQDTKKGKAHATVVLERAIAYINGVAPDDGHTVSSGT